jgi:hypothetical protein
MAAPEAALPLPTADAIQGGMRIPAIAALALALAGPAAAQTVACQATGQPLPMAQCDSVNTLQGRVQGALSRFHAPDPLPPGRTAELELDVRRPGAPSASGVLTTELSGDGFQVTPAGPQRQAIPADGAVTWRWRVKALQPGRRPLTLSAVLETGGVQLSSTIRRQWVTVGRGPASTLLQRLQALPAGLKLALVLLVGVAALLLARAAVKLALGRRA